MKIKDYNLGFEEGIKQTIGEINKSIDKHIKNISEKVIRNEIERKIYSGKIQTLKRLKNDLKTKYGGQKVTAKLSA